MRPQWAGEVGDLDHTCRVWGTFEAGGADNYLARSLDDEEPVAPRVSPARRAEFSKPLGRHLSGDQKLPETFSGCEAYDLVEEFRIIDQRDNVFWGACHQGKSGGLERHVRA